jgi:hypothetical protein
VKKIILIFAMVSLVMMDCNSDSTSTTEFGDLKKSVDVFGVKIIATPNTPDGKILHAAKVLAQYLDNNEDGEIDNQEVVDKLVQNNATLLMFRDESEAESFDFSSLPSNIQAAQDLYGSETNPDFNANSANARFDASLEEVLHLIISGGYADVYPHIFGGRGGTAIANAMDKARGGHFEQVPSHYPDGAWFSYDDESCEYGCQVAEYTYWALTSILGAQHYPGRFEEIQEEWKLNTAEKLQNYDTTIYNILTNPEYKLPGVLPDREYNGALIELKK